MVNRDRRFNATFMIYKTIFKKYVDAVTTWMLVEFHFFVKSSSCRKSFGAKPKASLSSEYWFRGFQYTLMSNTLNIFRICGHVDFTLTLLRTQNFQKVSKIWHLTKTVRKGLISLQTNINSNIETILLLYSRKNCV